MWPNVTQKIRLTIVWGGGGGVPISLCEHLCGNVSSVTRLGDLLDIGQLFKAFDNN